MTPSMVQGLMKKKVRPRSLGGGSPLHAVEVGSASLGKGVFREEESEGSR